MNSSPITLKEIRCPVGQGLFSSDDAYIGKWYLNVGDIFPHGSPLFEYVRPSVFGGTGRKETLKSSEPGVLISIRKGFLAADDNIAAENETVGTYVPLSEWCEFEKLLARHERLIAERRSDDGQELKRLEDECQRYRLDTKALLEEAPGLQEYLSVYRSETEQLRRLIAEQKQHLSAARAELETALGELPLEQLLQAVQDRFNALIASHDPAVQKQLHELQSAFGAILSARYRLPVEDFNRVHSELEEFQRIVQAFAAFGQDVSATMNNDELPENEMRARLMSRRQSLRKLANTAFKNDRHASMEAA